MNSRSTLALLSFALLGGCTMLSSRPMANGQSALVHYYLPRTVFHISVVEVKPAPDNAAAGESTPVAAAPGVIGTQPNAAPAAPAADARARNTHAAETPAEQLYDATHKTAGATADTKAAAPAGWPDKTRAVAPATAKPEYDVYIETREVAEVAQGHALIYNASAFSTDKFDVTVDDKGLLQGLNARPSDQSVEFVKKLGDLGIAVTKAVGAFAAAYTKPPMATAKVVFAADVDPAQAVVAYDRNKFPVLAALEHYGYRFEFVPPPHATTAASSGSDPCGAGLCFRSRQPVEMRVFERQDNSYQLIDDEFVSIPNFSPVFVEPIPRSFGVERDTLLTISNGYLTKVDVSKPAEVIAPVDGLIDLANDVAGIPASLIGLRQTKYDNQKKLIDSQKNLIDSQAELIDSQAALAEKQKVKASTAVTPPVHQ